MRSEDWLPADIRRILAHPRFLHFAVCACLTVLILACFCGIRSMANRRLEPLLLSGDVLSRHELVKVERALMREGMSDYKIENGQFLVPIGLRSQYIECLVEQEALPQPFGGSDRQALDESSILEPFDLRRKRFEVASEQAMSRIVREIDGIDDATVIYDEIKIGGIHPTREMTAMVAIRPSAGRVVDDELLTSIRNAVAGSKAGLDPADVTIMNLKTSGAGATSPYYAPQTHEARPEHENNTALVARYDRPFLAWIRSHVNQIVQATVVLLAVALVIGVFRDLFYQNEPRPGAERPIQDLRVYAPTDKKQSAVVEDPGQDTSAEQNDTFVHADLTELVREHPQAASAMLKSWVKEAG